MDEKEHCSTDSGYAVVGGVPVAAAAESTKGTTSEFDQFENSWLYLPDTVPEEYCLGNISGDVLLYPEDGSGEKDWCTSITVEFVSGDEALKDIVQISEVPFFEAGVRTDKLIARYEILLGDVKEPGEAVYHFICEGERLVYEQDVTLRVISWEDDPLFTLKGSEEDVLTLKVGDARTSRQILAETYEDHTQEIGQKLNLDPASVPSLERRWLMDFRDHETHNHIEESVYYVGEANNKEPTSPIVLIFNVYDPDEETFLFWEAGVYDTDYEIDYTNIRYDVKKTLAVLPYSITGANSIAPGATAQVRVEDLEEDSGRQFTLTLEGKGLTLDEASGTITAAEDAELGSQYMITATPSDGGYPVTLKGMVADGALGSVELEQVDYVTMKVPVIADMDGRYWHGWLGTGKLASMPVQNEPYYLTTLANTYYYDEYGENRDDAIRILTKETHRDDLTGIDEGIEDINGRPVLIITARSDDGNSIGIAAAIFQNIVFNYRLWSCAGEGGDQEALPEVSRGDMIRLMEMVEFALPEDYTTVADGAISLSVKDDVTSIYAGKKLKFTAAFANPDKVNQKNKNNTIEWSVTDAATGEVPEDITIDKNGNLSVNGKLAAPVHLVVKASSPIFHTEGIYELTAIPAVKKVTTEPAELFFYVGTNDPQTVRVVLDPDTVPLTGITWTAAKKDMLEITAADDGTVSIAPLAAGKTQVTVKEPGGKSGKLNVSVVEPVTALELTIKGKTIPGGTVNVTGGIQPKNAGNKNLEWSLNVGEDVATINAKGQVKIAKTAEIGTEITVTCRATGAPEPIETTISFEVTEK